MTIKMTEQTCSTCKRFGSNFCWELQRPVLKNFHCNEWKENLESCFNPANFDYSEVVRIIEEHAPAYLTLKYIKEHTGYKGNKYHLKKKLGNYPHIEYVIIGRLGTWRVRA